MATPSQPSISEAQNTAVGSLSSEGSTESRRDNRSWWFFFLFLCKLKYPKHPQHVQSGEVRWTAAWNWALIHPFCFLLMNTDNGKSVDAKTPQFLWIYRLIFCTSSSHFYACAKWWCKVLPNYHRDIFTLHFHWYGKWQVSKAKENMPLGQKRNTQKNKKLK